MLNQLFAIKPVDANAFANSGLKRVLGARQLLLLGIGAIIGAGIFVMTGTAAANYAGPGVMLSFVVPLTVVTLVVVMIRRPTASTET